MNSMNSMNTAEELGAAAARIWDWQQARGWTTVRMLREFPDLGSDKTYGSIRAGRLAELDAEAWLSRYAAVVALLEDRADDTDEDPVYDDLSAPRAVRRAMVDLFAASGNARVLVVLGYPGAGKTTALRCVADRYGRRVAWTEAADVWSDRPGPLLGAIMRALGTMPPVSATQRLDEVITLLRESRRCVVIDEAHHLGPHCLNTIKALVNQTPGEFVLSAIPTLWANMEKASYEEARQVTTNRLAERVILEMTEADCARYVQRAVPGIDEKQAKQMARLVAPQAPRLGNFAFLRDVCREVRRIKPESGQATAEMLAAAIAAAVRRRQGSR